MLDLRPHIRPGDGVWWSQAGGEATPLVDALLDQVGDIGPVRAFCGLSFNRRLRATPPGLTLVSYGAMGELRAASRSGSRSPAAAIWPPAIPACISAWERS